MRDCPSSFISNSAWYALYTKSRHEKFIGEELTKRRIESFLPTRKVKRRWSDRTVAIEEPLFKSYIFVKTDLSRKLDVLKVKGAVRFVSAGTDPIAIDENAIRSIRNIVDREIAIDPFPYLEEGQKVCIKEGLFKDTEGYIVRKDEKRCRLIVSIDAIRSSVSIEIDSCLAEKI